MLEINRKFAKWFMIKDNWIKDENIRNTNGESPDRDKNARFSVYREEKEVKMEWFKIIFIY